MQSKKKWLIALLGVAVVAGSVVVRAQNKDANNPYRAVVKARFEAMAKQINLSDAQKKSIAGLVCEAIPQGRAIAQNKELSSTQKQQKIKALRESTRGKITQLLTTEQRQTAQQLFASRETRMRATLNEVADELHLTNAQRAETKPIIEDAVQQGRAIFQDASGFAQKRAKLMELHAKTREKLASILTPEQMQKLDQMRAAVRAEAVSRIGKFGVALGFHAD